MLLLPGPRGRTGPQRSGPYRLRACGMNDRTIASYTFDDGTGTTLHDRRGYWPRHSAVDSWVIEGVWGDNGELSHLNGVYYREGVYAAVPYWHSQWGYIWWSSAASRWFLTNELGTGGGYYEAVDDGGMPATTWTYAEDTATGTYHGTTGQVVSAPLDGTLTGFTSDYSILVSGGAFSSTVFTPSGTEYGKTKYLSPDGNTKVSYWYEMDPEMDGSWYIWATTASHPRMDEYLSEKYTTGDAWGAGWSGGYTVAQGALQPGPWFGDGLEFGGGYVELDIPDALKPGTGDFTLCFEYTYKEGGSLFSWHVSGSFLSRITLYKYNDGLQLTFENAAGAYFEGLFPNSASAFVAGADRAIAVQFIRGAAARLFMNGKYISQVDISSVTGSFDAMDTCRIGTPWGDYTNWYFKGRMRRFEYHKRALTDREAAAWTGNPWQVFSQPRLPMMAFPAAGGGGTAYTDADSGGFHLLGQETDTVNIPLFDADNGVFLMGGQETDTLFISDADSGLLTFTTTSRDRLTRAPSQSTAEWDFVRAQIGGR